MKATPLSLPDPDVLIIVTWAASFGPETIIHRALLKLYWDIATSKQVCVVCGCPRAPGPKLTSYDRD